jgi:hypothetical protein
MMKRANFSGLHVVAASALLLVIGAGYPAGQPHSSAQTGFPATFARPLAAAPHAAVKAWMSPLALGQHLVYVSNSYNSFVNIYPAAGQSQQPVGTITKGISGPEGLAVDAAGNLYVTNSASNTVTVYPPGQLNPSTTYSNGLAFPYGVSVGTDGTLYVANIMGGINGFGSVSVYPPGSTNPSLTLTLDQYYAVGVATDSANNLYVLWFQLSSYTAAVYKYAPGSSSGTNLQLALPIGMFPGNQIAFDGSGNLVLTYEDAKPQFRQHIVAFPPGTKRPIRKVDLGSLGNYGTGFAFSQSSDFLYIALANANVWVRLTYPKDPQAEVLPRDLVNIQGNGLALSPGT